MKTLKELYDRVKAGEIDESQLMVMLDNDCTSFHVGEDTITVKEANGYYDIEPLYRLLFPGATVEWC